MMLAGMGAALMPEDVAAFFLPYSLLPEQRLRLGYGSQWIEANGMVIALSERLISRLAAEKIHTVIRRFQKRLCG